MSPHGLRRRAQVLGMLCVELAAASCIVPREMVRVASPSGCRASPPDTAALAWYGPSEERDAQRVQAWCETVAAPLVSLRPAADLGSWRAADTLVVMSWNTNMGGGDLPAFFRDELALDCSVEPPAPLPGFSPLVLLLQEAYRREPGLLPVERGLLIPWRIEPDPRPGADIERVARTCGLALLYVPSARNGVDPPGSIPEDKGNAILSSLPLAGAFAVELPFEAGRKVAVGALVTAASGDTLQLVSVHLDVASTLYRTLLTGNGTRLRQIAGLTDVLDARPPLATVVGGDFNTWSVHEGALVHMQEHFPDVRIDDSGTRGGMPADHVFFRRSAGGRLGVVPGSYRRSDSAYLSDHHARAIRIVVGGGS